MESISSIYGAKKGPKNHRGIHSRFDQLSIPESQQTQPHAETQTSLRALSRLGVHGAHEWAKRKNTAKKISLHKRLGQFPTVVSRAWVRPPCYACYAKYESQRIVSNLKFCTLPLIALIKREQWATWFQVCIGYWLQIQIGEVVHTTSVFKHELCSSTTTKEEENWNSFSNWNMDQ